MAEEIAGILRVEVEVASSLLQRYNNDKHAAVTAYFESKSNVSNNLNSNSMVNDAEMATSIHRDTTKKQATLHTLYCNSTQNKRRVINKDEPIKNESIVYISDDDLETRHEDPDQSNSSQELTFVKTSSQSNKRSQCTTESIPGVDQINRSIVKSHKSIDVAGESTNGSNVASSSAYNLDTPWTEFSVPEQSLVFIPSTNKISYSFLVEIYRAVDKTRKRLAIMQILVNALRTVMQYDQDALLPIIYLCINRIGPAHAQSELGIGDSMVATTVREVTGVSRDRMREMYRQFGDLGDIAAVCRGKQRLLIRPKPLPITTVFNELKKISTEQGKGSVQRRRASLLKLLRAAQTPDEMRYLVRTFISHLRVGISIITVIQAAARARVLHEKLDTSSANDKKLTETQLIEAGEEAKRLYYICPNLDELIPAMIRGGIEEMKLVAQPKPSNPISPMLAKVTNDVDTVCNSVEATGCPFICEYKYDGQRSQIHYFLNDQGEPQVKIFSRNLSDSTERWPDICAIMMETIKHHNDKYANIQRVTSSQLESMVHASRQNVGQRFDYPVHELILDTEIVPVELSNDGEIVRILPFQKLASRPKRNVSIQELSVSVCIFSFDLLYFNGINLMDMQLWSRRMLLQNILPIQSSQLKISNAIVVSKELNLESMSNVLMKWLKTAYSQFCEGLMCKALGDVPPETAQTLGTVDLSTFHNEDLQYKSSNTEDMTTSVEIASASKFKSAAYQPSIRADNWLKLKRDYINELADSLDLVPIGGWWGNGRKAGWISPVLLACWDSELERYQSVCRCMSGFTDGFYKEMTEFFKKNLIVNSNGTKPIYYETAEQPSIWFQPKVVWEIRGADLTLSPVHQAAAHLFDEEDIEEKFMGRGIALRFPRFIRERDDKSPEDASTAQQVLDMFIRQQHRAS